MYEDELQTEWEDEAAFELEEEGELEDEAEEFFGRLAGLARRAAQSPALRRVGLSAARTALRGLGSAGGDVGDAIGGSRGAALGRRLGKRAGGYLSRQLPQREFEDEFEAEFEDEDEAQYEDEFEEEDESNPIRRVYADALMEHMGHAATTARSEAEAEAFIGALVPLAARSIPRAAPALLRATPGLVRGLAGAARTLRSSPTTRPLVRALPTVMRRTAMQLARQAAQGQPVTPQVAVRTLARQTAQVVGNPRQAARAYQRSSALDRRYHRQK